ncbi:MAG: FkbM family methyltransferase [Bacteroidetes bacterium]|nr:FkbM family methyltransferase [Bacteroidota bacterium]MBX7128924.1 FkbM family methyltransferase [Flavobacteriales bacterium]MCC6654886.1 FkbM family methyltransferase [Flavobacteriales bacterium]HMU14591.1 FkbM family methyltransferase [Flavobacteriales bacterium]HMW96281.1 FkbM family methyltransferase [Flavobacteriales bacterium]
MKALRLALRALIQAAPFKGRYRLADKAGAALAGDLHEVFGLNGVGVGIDHAVLTHRLMYYGLYEENVMNFLRRDLRPGDVVFDPGANIGYFAAVCLGLVGSKGHVYSFEPSNAAHAHILKNNPSPPANWTLEHAALTDHSGEMTFYDTPRVMTRGFACLEGTYEPKDRIPHQVKVFSLDDYCAARNINTIAFLKLDIEGSELKALQGAARMLASDSVRTVLVETTLLDHTVEMTRTIDDLLRGYGYRSHRARRNGVPDPINVMEHLGLREDILWTRTER